MRRQGRQRGAEKDLFYPPAPGFGYPVAHGLGKDARQVGQYGRVQVLRFDAHIARQTDEIFKAERVFRRHQLQHIQTVGADGLVDKIPSELIAVGMPALTVSQQEYVSDV